MQPGPEQSDEPSFQFENVPIEILVSVGTAKPLISELLQLGENSVLELDKRIEDPVDLYIGGRLIARGFLEECADHTDQRLAVRLVEITQPNGKA